MLGTHECLSKQIELLHPLVHATLDRTDVARTRDRRNVDVTVVKQHLYVVCASHDERVLVILVRNHDELHRLPRVLHLSKWCTKLEHASNHYISRQ